MKDKVRVTEAPEIDMQLVGSRFRSLRRHRNLTQKEAAVLAGTTAKHISEAERGACGISLQVLARLCTLYEVSADYILFGEQTDSREDFRISSRYDQLSPEKQHLFEQMVQALLASLSDTDS